MHTTGSSTQTKTLLSGSAIAVWLFQFRAFVALIVLMIVFSFLTPSFFTYQNLIILVGQTAINAIMAVGMTFVILTGGIDLSVGSTVGLAAMTAGLLIDRGVEIPVLGMVIYFNIPAVILLVLCLGMFIGAINGILITRFNVAPFIATLGMLYVARGAAQLSNGGATFPNLVGQPELRNTGFPILGAGSLLGIPIIIWIVGLYAGAGIFVAASTLYCIILHESSPLSKSSTRGKLSSCEMVALSRWIGLTVAPKRATSQNQLSSSTTAYVVTLIPCTLNT